jgi:hypothetical protein
MEAADAAELSGTAALIKQVSGTSTLLLVAALTRGGELRTELADLLRESERLGVAVVHRLEGLSPSEVANALELSGGGAVPPDWQAWLAAACPLPPGVLWARMAELAAAGSVAAGRHHWWTGLRWSWRSGPPEPHRPAMTLPEVTADERALLGAAAALGERFRVSDLVPSLGVPEMELAESLDRLGRRGIVAFRETLEIDDDFTDVYEFPGTAEREAWRHGDLP